MSDRGRCAFLIAGFAQGGPAGKLRTSGSAANADSLCSIGSKPLLFRPKLDFIFEAMFKGAKLFVVIPTVNDSLSLYPSEVSSSN